MTEDIRSDTEEQTYPDTCQGEQRADANDKVNIFCHTWKTFIVKSIECLLSRLVRDKNCHRNDKHY